MGGDRLVPSGGGEVPVPARVGGADIPGIDNRIVRNPSWKDSTVGIFSRLAVRVRTVLPNTRVPPPVSPYDPVCKVKMCVIYHVKRIINDRCG